MPLFGEIKFAKLLRTPAVTHPDESSLGRTMRQIVTAATQYVAQSVREFLAVSLSTLRTCKCYDYSKYFD